MNRILLFAVTVIATLFCSQNVWAEEREYTDTQKVVYTYDTDGTTAKVKAGSFEKGCGSPDAFGDVVIPEKITIDNKSYTVTEIGFYAFHDNQNITSVSMPNTVLSVGEEAFETCWSLSDVVLSESLEEISSGTFNQCGLKNIVIPEGVKKIGSCAFRWCYVDNIQIPSSVTTIDNEAFRCCPLTSMRIPATVTHIGDNPFKGCPITSMVVEEGNPYYDSRNNCNAIILTAENKIISGFETTEFPADVKIIGGGAFADSEMKKFTIPEGIEKIESGAFFSCWSLEEISLPSTLKEISDQVFCYCWQLSTIKIPSSVTTIGYRCFSESGLVSFTFPEGFTTIENTMFERCKSLQEVVIPASVTTIRNDAFKDCPNLQRVICKNSTPVELGINERIFELEDGTFTNSTLYVPANSIESYKGADVWKNFKSIKSLEEYISEEQLALGIGDVETLSDGTFNVPIALTNNITITAFQMDIKADNGATVEGVTLSDRASADHSVSTKKLDDGTLRVIVYSNTSQPFAGDNGTLLNIQVSVQSGNEHFISLTNIEMTGTDGTEYDLSDFSNKFVSFLIGDANCDGNVTITDVTAIINHILGDTPSPFNTNAADVNRNGKVSVSDIVLLINNYILTANSNVSNRSFAIEDDMNAVLTLANPKVIDNHSVNISMVMNNQEQDITAFQCDVLLPDDIRLADNGLTLDSNRSTDSHMIVSKMISDNVLRIVCYSMQNESFAGMSDAVLNITLETEQLQEGKEYSIGLRNIELSTTQAESVLSKNVSLSFTADKGIDAIENIKAKANKDTRVYNMKGQSIPNSTLQRGIYINAGRKYLK